jgi:hypothetical protein
MSTLHTLTSSSLHTRLMFKGSTRTISRPLRLMFPLPPWPNGPSLPSRHTNPAPSLCHSHQRLHLVRRNLISSLLVLAQNLSRATFHQEILWTSPTCPLRSVLPLLSCSLSLNLCVSLSLSFSTDGPASSSSDTFLSKEITSTFLRCPHRREVVSVRDCHWIDNNDPFPLCPLQRIVDGERSKKLGSICALSPPSPQPRTNYLEGTIDSTLLIFLYFWSTVSASVSSGV